MVESKHQLRRLKERNLFSVGLVIDMMCRNCGAEVYDARFCPHCGSEILVYDRYMSTSPKSGIVLILLWFFLGVFGAHRFYAGKIPSGILMMVLTVIGVGIPIVGIWLLADLVMICCGRFKDQSGYPIKFG